MEQLSEKKLLRTCLGGRSATLERNKPPRDGENFLDLVNLLAAGGAGNSGAEHPRERASTHPVPFPSIGRAITHKLEDDEPVREGEEDGEATGQGAATRSRCRGHACELALVLGLDTRASGSAQTTRPLRRAQWQRRPRALVKS